MEIKISSLTIATSSVQDLTAFLTHVLDIEIKSDEKLPYAQLSSLKINFIETAITDTSVNSYLTIVIPDNDFESIIDKFTFFMFRKGIEAKNYYDVTYNGVFLKDLDGRLWKVIPDNNSHACLTL